MVLEKVCPTCYSIGKCRTCDGLGTVFKKNPRWKIWADAIDAHYCTICAGAGKCTTCDGTGMINVPSDGT